MLEAAVSGDDSGNWAAWYHLGIIQYNDGDADQAVTSFQNSVRADENLWAFRAMALISYEQITNRCFEDWSMRVADLNDLPLASRDLLRAKYSEEEGYIEIPDDSPQALALLFDARALCLSETE